MSSKKNKNKSQSNQNKSQSKQNKPQKTNSSQVNSQKSNQQVAKIQKLDSRTFSKEAYEALKKLQDKIKPENKENSDSKNKKADDELKKASALVQGLTAYISTWGLHRLSGDAQKFLKKESNNQEREKKAKKGEDTKYKGIVYQKFLESLKNFSNIDFDVDDAGSLIHLPLREYTALNRLAIKLAKEWAFWAPSVLGEANNEQ